MIAHRLLTPPASEPVTLAEIKAHMRLLHDDDDVLLEGLIRAARQWCEHFTRRAFIAQSWVLSLSSFGDRRFIALPRGPVLSVTAARLLDEEGGQTLLDSALTYCDIALSRLVLREGAAWPEPSRGSGGVEIEYVAGFGAGAASVPDDLKLAIMQLAAHWYEHRGDALTGETASKAPLTIEALLSPYRALSMAGA